MHAWARYHSPKMALAENDNVGQRPDRPRDPPVGRQARDGVAARRARPSRGSYRSRGRALARRDHQHHAPRRRQHERDQVGAGVGSGRLVRDSRRHRHEEAEEERRRRVDDPALRLACETSGTSRSGHAIVLAGYEDTPHGTFYLVHNSWGTKWGTDGYAWMWEKTLRANLAEAFVLQVRPVEGARVRHSAPAHKFSNCSAGLAPDAMTTQCVPTCPDGGPRVNGVCPTAGQCPDGEVNLDGKCELSAPDLNKTLSNGVKVSCGLSGCTYVVPNGPGVVHGLPGVHDLLRRAALHPRERAARPRLQRVGGVSLRKTPHRAADPGERRGRSRRPAPRSAPPRAGRGCAPPPWGRRGTRSPTT